MQVFDMAPHISRGLFLLVTLALAFPNGESVTLPPCPASNILSGTGGVPDNWASLSLYQQVTDPSNALILQLAYAAWKDNPVAQFGACLGAMGIVISSITQINAPVAAYGGTMTAVVMRAGTKAVFVSFRGTDFDDPGDVAGNADCVQTSNLRTYFGSTRNIKLHTGFNRAWLALEPGVTTAITQQLTQVTGPKRVYFIGHSLGGAIAAQAALRYNFLWNNTANLVSGVWLFGCPRIGDEGWRSAYNDKLLPITLRFSNFADSVVRVPAETQTCSQPTFPFLGSYNYTHIGKSILLCPYAVGLNLFDRNLGLVKWVLNATGTEGLDCDPLISGVPVLSPTPLTTPGRTHWLGPHLDAWRRGVTFATGNNLATSPQIANTICAECGAQFLNIDKQINQPARAGGPVACSDLITSSDCKKRKAYEAAASVGNTETKPYNSLSFCLGYLCT